MTGSCQPSGRGLPSNGVAARARSVRAGDCRGIKDTTQDVGDGEARLVQGTEEGSQLDSESRLEST